MTKAEEQRREKARKMRYKRPIMRELNLYTIVENLEQISNDAYDLRWTEDSEALIAALDGDEDEAFQFRLEFSDVEAEAERMLEDIREKWIPEEFDVFFPAVSMDGTMLGFDPYEGDYYGIEPWETEYAQQEAEKKITGLTKKQIIETAGYCLRVALQYTALMYRYDCLRAAIDILKGQNEGLLNTVRAIEAQYEKAETETNGFKDFYSVDALKMLDRLLEGLPDRVWIE